MWNNICKLLFGLEVVYVRARGALLVECCIGAGAVLLIAAAFFFFLSYAGGSGGKSAEREAEIERVYEDTLREIEELEGRTAARGEEAEGEACVFEAFAARTSGDVAARAAIEFTRSADISIDRMFVLGDSEEWEVPIADAKRKISPLEEGNVRERIELADSDVLPTLLKVAEYERVSLRFQGDYEGFYARLPEAQLLNIKDALRLYEAYHKAMALEELRRTL